MVQLLQLQEVQVTYAAGVVVELFSKHHLLLEVLVD
jgi:hypothetical protein